MGFSSLTSSANHQVLVTSLSCILATSTYFSYGIQAAFIRSIVSINHSSTSNDLSVPENTAGCSLLKWVTFPGLCPQGVINKPWCKIFVCFYQFSIMLYRSLIWSFISLGPPWEEPEPSRFPCIFMSTRNWNMKRWEVSGSKWQMIMTE